MTIVFLCISWLFVHLSFLKYITAEWPLQNFSTIKLLGLFPDADNTMETTELSIHSRAMFQAAILLAQKYNITIEGQYIEWQSEQTGGNIMDALRDTCQAISSSSSTIVGIVGPAYSREAQQIANFGNTIGLPVISYSATDSELSNRNDYPTFYRTVPSDDIAAIAIVNLFLQYNWTSCIIIYQNDPYGTDGVNSVSTAFVNHGLKVNKLIIFDIVTRQIRGDLKNDLINSPSRIVLVWASITYTYFIVQNALDNNVLGPKFTWILSTSVPLTSFNHIYYPNLIGIITIEPVTGNILDVPINSTLLNDAYDIWKEYELETFPSSMKINPYALFAFDATWILIQSLQKFCSTISSPCLVMNGSSFCFDRYFIHSDQLLNIINTIELIGVSGPIQFNLNTTNRINGSYYYLQNIQLTSKNISFVPVLQYSYPGNWEMYSGANVIVWPGSSLIPPIGQTLLEGITLRIGVIETPVFTIVNSESIMNLTGYAIDLIELLRTEMNFIPDIKLVRKNETYSELIQAVADGIYDIVVGDVTITAARKEIVDFSNSIFDNSLRLMTRKTYTNAPDPLSFLKPFSFNLWITFLSTWIFASILFCFVERETNDMLQNRSLLSQIIMSML